jgi:hypothetical protein
MATTATELAEARETLTQLLDRLDLVGHRFELGLEGDAWDVGLECQAPDGWLSVQFGIPRQALRAAAADTHARQRLVDTLDARLRGCQRRPPASHN